MNFIILTELLADGTNRQLAIRPDQIKRIYGSSKQDDATFVILNTTPMGGLNFDNVNFHIKETVEEVLNKIYTSEEPI